MDTPMVAPGMVDPGFAGDDTSFIAPVSAIMVRQKLQIFEQFCPACEKQNFYRVGVCDSQTVANPPEGAAFNQMTPSFVVQEDSTCACRFWCGNMREFKLLVSQAAGPDSPGQPLLRMERPFKCTIACFGCIACPQEMTISSNTGKVLGSVVQDWNCGRCWEAACCPGGYYYYQIRGPSGDPQFYIRMKYPSFCNGCVNFCAPTCLNKAFCIDILDADGQTVLSQMKNVFPGWNCRCVADSSNLLMEFPQKASADQKALLMGALFLIEYIYFEKNKDQGNG